MPRSRREKGKLFISLSLLLLLEPQRNWSFKFSVSDPAPGIFPLTVAWSGGEKFSFPQKTVLLALPSPLFWKLSPCGLVFGDFPLCIFTPSSSDNFIPRWALSGTITTLQGLGHTEPLPLGASCTLQTWHKALHLPGTIAGFGS